VNVPVFGAPLLTTSDSAALAQASLQESSGTAGDWLCAWCLNRVANEKDRFSVSGRDEFDFANPEGVRFQILTFLQTHDCHRTGEPTLEFTWFPGYAWSYCHCGRCGQHLGWYYTGANEFVGLIKPRLARALFVRN
jgi:hypothetical protein